MSAPTALSPASNPALPAAKKKRVLLVDMSAAKRDLRSETMRRLGVEVDCAADISEARSWWRADLYDLVLINIDNSTGLRDKFCDDLRSATPSQQIMFLVGKPEYLATSPSLDGQLPAEMQGLPPALWSELQATLSINHSESKPQRWGIMEACRRISEVRSISDARTRAMRDRPSPPRDSEMARPSRTEAPDLLDELIAKEMQ